MSNYDNFIQDFPCRCGKILNEYKEHVTKDGYEVTHMLSTASASITIPYARLTEKENPSLDKKKYEHEISFFNGLHGKLFKESCLWKSLSKSWKSGFVKKEDIKSGPDNWDKNVQCLQDDMKVKEILKIIRNALAHGNIFTLHNRDNQIENILFLSKEMINNDHTGNYKLLMVSPNDFNDFLVKWIDFLNTLKIPPELD